MLLGAVLLVAPAACTKVTLSEALLVLQWEPCWLAAEWKAVGLLLLSCSRGAPVAVAAAAAGPEEEQAARPASLVTPAALLLLLLLRLLLSFSKLGSSLKVPFAVALPSLPNTPLDVFFGTATAALKAAGTDAAAADETAAAAATAATEGVPAWHCIVLKAGGTCAAATKAVRSPSLFGWLVLLSILVWAIAQPSAAELSTTPTHPAKLMSDKRTAAGTACAV
jgi:hypothetical protein